jgi:4-amino-4-deoxy-L-arabinose transferase-like glycosyltransferase
LNLVWIAEHRLSFPLNYDEAAFMAMARYDSLRLVTLGPIGLARAYVVQGPAAPLVPLASVPAQVLGGASNLPSFGVIQAFLVLLAIATYGLGARLGGPMAGLMSMIAVTTAPGVIYFSRMYHYAVPSAAVLAALLYALLSTRGFERRDWSLIWGLLLGLLALTRSVTLALMPGIVLAAMVAVIVQRGRRAAFMNLVLGLIVATAVAATWYGFNLTRVLEYLMVGGYGPASAMYGEARSPASVEFWLARLTHLVHQGLYLPLAVVLVLLSLAAGVVGFSRSEDRQAGGISQSAAVDHLVIGIVLVSGYLALSSSSNVGSGFVLLLLPMLIPLAASVASWGLPTLGSRLALALLGIVGMVNVFMTSIAGTPLNAARHATVPLLGSLPLTDGRYDIQNILAIAGYDSGLPGERLPEPHGRWLEIDRELTDLFIRSTSPNDLPVAAFASRDPIVTVGSVRLAGLVWHQRNLSLFELSGADPDDTVVSYANRLASLSPRPNFLVAADPGPAEAPPRVTQELAEVAARASGFQPVHVIKLPGGRAMRVWQRD